MSDDQIYVGSTERLLQLEAALARFAATIEETLAAAEVDARERIRRLDEESSMHAAHAALQQEAADADAKAGRESAAVNQRTADNSRTAAAGAATAANDLREELARCMARCQGLRGHARRQIPEARTFLRRRVEVLEEYVRGGEESGSP